MILLLKIYVNVCTSTDAVCTNENEPCTNQNENENEPCTNENENENEPCTNENDDDDDDGNDKPGNNDNNGNNDNKPDNNGNNDNKPGNKDNNDNKPGNNDNKDNKQGNKDKGNKPVTNDDKKSHQMNFVISLRKQFLNNITKIIELVNELNDEIYADDQWLVFAQLNKINPLIDELINHIWSIIYNKKRKKNEIINIGFDKVKDIEGCVHIYNGIINDKLEFVNEISELFNNAIEKKDFKNLKDDALESIGNSCVYDVKRKGCKIDNKEKNSDVKRKGCKKDNKEKDSDDSENDNNNDNNDRNNNLIDKLLNNDKLNNLNDNVLNNLFIIAKSKKELLINIEKIRTIFNKIDNIPKNDLRSELDK